MESKVNPISILSRASQADLVTTPYPHLIINDALAPEVFAQLAREYPSDEIILDGREAAETHFEYSAFKVLKDERVSPLWRKFIKYHTSKEFFLDLLQLAGPQLLALNPDLERKAGRKLEEFAIAMRPEGSAKPLAEGANISLECQFSINYTRQPRVVRGPHIDRPSQLFAALLYFRREDDESIGGDLGICEATTDIYPNPHAVKISTLPAEIDDSKVRTIKSIPYAPNTLVLFLNSARSIHAVSPRTPTPVPRRHINFSCDLPFGLYEIIVPTNLKLISRWEASTYRPRQAAKNLLLSTPVLWRLAKYL